MRSHRFAIFLMLAFFLWSPSAAQAAASFTGYEGYTCINPDGNGNDGKGITVRIVGCVKDLIFDAAEKPMKAVLKVAQPTINIMTVLLVLISGIMIMGARSPPMVEVAKNFAKVVFVVAVTANIMTYFDRITDELDRLVEAVTLINEGDLKDIVGAECPVPDDPTVSVVWYGLDCMLDRLVGGVSSSSTLKQGIISLLIACLFAGGMGFLIALLGGFLVFTFIYAVTQALFVYITAIVAIAMLVIVSPLFIPCILFRSTQGYFTAWLGMLFNFFMQPVVLFAYLSMLMLSLGYVLFTSETSIYKTLGGGGLSSTGHTERATLVSTDVNVNPKTSGITPSGSSSQGLAGQPAAYPLLNLLTDPKFEKDFGLNAQSFFKVSQPVQRVKWSDGQKLQVLISFLSAALTAYIMLELLRSMPYIGNAISKGQGGFESLGTGSISPTDNVIAKNVQSLFSGIGR